MKFTIKEPVFLCYSCENSQIMKNSIGKITIQCNYQRTVKIITDVVECNVYMQKGQMQQYDAEKIAWILEKKGERVIGFKPPKSKREND